MEATKQSLLDALKDLRQEADRVASDASDAAGAASEISSYASDAESNANRAEERAREISDAIDSLEDQVDALGDTERHEMTALALSTLSAWSDLYQKVSAEIFHTINGDNPLTEADRIGLEVLKKIAEHADWSFGDLKMPHLMESRQWVIGDYATQIILRSFTPQGKTAINDGSVSVHPVVENR